MVNFCAIKQAIGCCLNRARRAIPTQSEPSRSTSPSHAFSLRFATSHLPCATPTVGIHFRASDCALLVGHMPQPFTEFRTPTLPLRRLLFWYIRSFRQRSLVSTTLHSRSAQNTPQTHSMAIIIHLLMLLFNILVNALPQANIAGLAAVNSDKVCLIHSTSTLQLTSPTVSCTTPNHGSRLLDDLLHQLRQPLRLLHLLACVRQSVHLGRQRARALVHADLLHRLLLLPSRLSRLHAHGDPIPVL